MRAAAVALLGGAAVVALSELLDDEPSDERELLRVRNRGPANEVASAPTPREHVLQLDDDRQPRKIDADRQPLMLWVRLPTGRSWYVRKEGTAYLSRAAEHVRDDAHWFGFRVTKGGDAKLTVLESGRYVGHFNVKITNLQRTS